MKKIYKSIIVIIMLALILTSCQQSNEVTLPKPSLINPLTSLTRSRPPQCFLSHFSERIGGDYLFLI